MIAIVIVNPQVMLMLWHTSDVASDHVLLLGAPILIPR